MFEHVGVNHYGAFFAKVKSLLAPDGVALLHSIGRKEGPGSTRPWIRKYIFPGGYVPALSEVLPVVERLRLWITDIEILRSALCRDAAGLAAALRTKSRPYQSDLRRTLLPDVGDLSRRLGTGVPARQDHMVFQMQLAKVVDAVPTDPRLHGRLGARAQFSGRPRRLTGPPGSTGWGSFCSRSSGPRPVIASLHGIDDGFPGHTITCDRSRTAPHPALQHDAEQALLGRC